MTHFILYLFIFSFKIDPFDSNDQIEMITNAYFWYLIQIWGFQTTQSVGILLTLIWMLKLTQVIFGLINDHVPEHGGRQIKLSLLNRVNGVNQSDFYNLCNSYSFNP